MNKRLRAIAALGAAVALSSCTPAHQDASPIKVDTAVLAGTPSAVTPGYIDCFGAPVARPTELSLRCVDDSVRLVNIEWDSWGTTLATGRATLLEPGFEPREVPVSLSSPVGASFTDLVVDGELAYP